MVRTDPAATPLCFALVPCAGSGSRAAMSGPKQYARLAGRSVVAHTLRALGAVQRLRATLVVLAPDDTAFEAAAAGFAGERAWVARVGGATRAASVANGLAELRRRGDGDDDWVLVHDAARCLIRPPWVDRLIDACADDPVGGLLALPVADTLERALGAAGGGVTDESGAVEALGQRPLLVRGEVENFKLTWPGDFALAARLLASSPALDEAAV